MSAGLIVSLRGRWSFSSPESSRNWPQQPSSSQDRARRRFRVVEIDTERSASSRVSTDGRRQSETVRARPRGRRRRLIITGVGERARRRSRARSGIIGRSGNVGGRGQGRTSGTASGDRGVGDAEHQMGDGGRFVGGGGGVGPAAASGAWRGDATSAAELLGEGLGLDLQSVLFGRPAVGVRRVSGDAVQRVSGDAEHLSKRVVGVGRRDPALIWGSGSSPPSWAVRRLRAGPHACPGTRVRRAAAPYVSLRFRGLRARFMAKILRWSWAHVLRNCLKSFADTWGGHARRAVFGRVNPRGACPFGLASALRRR